MNLSSNVWLQELTQRLKRAQGTAPATPRLLIVDDDPGIRAFLMRSLALVECVPIVATNGAEALELFDKIAPIDLLLSDLMMPGMNGLELGRRLQQTNPDLKILYLTGYSDALFEERPLLGANEAFVDKPISSAGLHQAVSLALYGHLTGLVRRGQTAPKPVVIPQNTAWV
jgi:two-component system cell cycle sensor histidine kinase/response regulator CckA